MIRIENGNTIVDNKSVPKEFSSRIFGGELSDNDFSTEHPNEYRINKIAAGTNQYFTCLAALR